MAQEIPIMILKEGTDRSRGREAQRSNIMAARIIAETVKSALGPKGMDKMLVDSLGDITITSDGATVLKEMDIQHPVAKMMVDVAKITDDEVGDGTTSVVILSGKLLEKAESLINQNIHPTIIVDGYRAAMEKALQFLNEIAISIDPKDKSMLKKVAMTAMASKIVAENREYLADLVVNAIIKIAQKTKEGYRVDIDDIKVEKKSGESIVETKIIEGMIIDKEVVHPGMPKRIEDVNITLINSPLEVEKPEFSTEIHIEKPEEMKAFLDEEEQLLKAMADKIVATGAKVLASQKGIDDVVQHFLAKEGIMAFRRVSQSNLEKLAKATGGKIIANIEDLTNKDLGYAKLVEERKVGDDKWIFIEGCKDPKAVTIFIRGGTEKVINEAERSIHDALCVVRDVFLMPMVVAGGGAPEMEVASRLRKWVEQLSGKEQLAAMCFAESMEVIPVTLAENAGLDPIDILVELRSNHDKGNLWVGVDFFKGKVKDMSELNVYEPLIVKEQIIKSASESVCMIIRIDDVIAAKKTMGPPAPPQPPSDIGDLED